MMAEDGRSCFPSRMIRTIAIYGVGLATVALLLEGLQLRLALRLVSPDLYAVGIAAIFALLGIWAGRALTRQKSQGPFARNDQAIASLGLSPRELAVLDLLAAGKSNKEIARMLAISPNTVKTHVTNVYAKLDAARRTDAVHKARALAIVP